MNKPKPKKNKGARAWAIVKDGKIVQYSPDDWIFSYGVFNKKYLAEKYHQACSEKVVPVEIKILNK